MYITREFKNKFIYNNIKIYFINNFIAIIKENN